MKYKLSTVLLTLFLLSACQPANLPATEDDHQPVTTSETDGGDPLDAQGFTEALALAGATIGEQGEVEQPFFSVPGKVFTVNGETIQVFEYSDSAQVDQEAAQVAPDGSSIGTTMASWVASPHFFRSERLIVLYVGENQSVIELIETVLGSQFAGAEIGEEGGLTDEPTAAIMKIGEDQQVSGIGSYCWPTESEGVGLCADMIGIPTSPDPILVESPFSAQFTIPLTTPPDTMVVSITPVDLEDRMDSDVEGMYWWSPDPTDQSNKHLSPPYEIELELEPGLYLLNVFAQWQDIGDVSYGFLVEVAPAQVSESPGGQAEPATVVVLAEAGLNLRDEPDLSSEVIGFLSHNELVDVIDQSPDGDWWQVVCPDGIAGSCWISADPLFSELVDLSDFSLAGLIYSDIDQQPERPFWLIGTDGTPTLIVENSNEFGSLSPDGEQMITCCYPRGETNLHLVDLEASERLQLTDTQDRYNYNPQWWEANPETIVFVSNVVNPNDQPRPGAGNLAMVKTDGTGFEVLDSEHLLHTSFSLSPDGQTIAYTTGDEKWDETGILTPWVYHMKTGATPFDYSEYGLDDLPNLSFGNPAWSPDGRYIAWVIGGDLDADSEWKNGIAIFDLESQSVEILNAHVPASCLFAWCPSTPDWSPDSQWLAWYIFPEGGGPSFMVTRPDGSDEQIFDKRAGPIWSPDSRLVVFIDVLSFSVLVMEVGEWQPLRTELPANVGPVMWIGLD